MLSRRGFIQNSLRACACAVLGSSLDWLAGCSPGCSLVRPSKPHKYVLADVHNHLMLNEWNAQSAIAVKDPAIDYLAKTLFDKTDTNLRRAHEAGVDLICATHFNLFDEWLAMPTDPNPAAPENALRMMTMLEEEVNGPSARYATLMNTPDKFEKHFYSGYSKDPGEYRIGILQSIEGGHALGGSLEPLEIFSKRGIAIITIGHFFNKGIASAPNAFPFFPDMDSALPKQGLSHFGEDVIHEMERLGIIVDVTHATTTALTDILRVSSKPLIATHISVRTLGNHAISLHEDQIQEIAQRGGIVGIIFHPYWLSNYLNVPAAEKHGSLREVIRTIRHVVKITNSTRSVCIGTDFGAYIPQLTDMNCLCQEEMLRNHLMDEFEDEQIVENILARNVLDFIRSNWKIQV